MSTNIRLDLAQHIRYMDGRNDLTCAALSTVVVVFVGEVTDRQISRGEMDDLMSGINPDKTMGAAALADAVVDHFHLDQEH